MRIFKSLDLVNNFIRQVNWGGGIFLYFCSEIIKREFIGIVCVDIFEPVGFSLNSGFQLFNHSLGLMNIHEFAGYILS